MTSRFQIVSMKVELCSRSMLNVDMLVCDNIKPGGLDLTRRDLDRDLDLDVQKISVSTVEKISTVFKS